MMAEPTEGPSTYSTSGTTGTVYVIYVYEGSCSNSIPSDFSRMCAPADDEIVEQEPNGDLSHLYRNPAKPQRRATVRFDRKSSPRWRAGRWKAKT